MTDLAQQLLDNGWTMTASGKWKHPTLIPSEHGRALPVSMDRALQLNRPRQERTSDPMKRLVSYALIGELFRRDVLKELGE